MQLGNSFNSQQEKYFGCSFLYQFGGFNSAFRVAKKISNREKKRNVCLSALRSCSYILARFVVFGVKNDKN